MILYDQLYNTGSPNSLLLDKTLRLYDSKSKLILACPMTSVPGASISNMYTNNTDGFKAAIAKGLAEGSEFVSEMKKYLGEALDFSADIINSLITMSNQMDWDGENKSQIVNYYEKAKYWSGSDSSIELPQLHTLALSSEELGKVVGDTSKPVKKLINNILDVVCPKQSSMTSMIIKYDAPNDFKPSGGFGTNSKGTFRLEIGTICTIDNLIIRNFRFIPSSVLTPDDDLLYADINITLDYASVLTPDNIRDMAK